MKKFYKLFDSRISGFLLIIGMIVAIVQCLELTWSLGVTIYEKATDLGLQYVPEHGRDVVVLFFNVLLTLEVMETVKVFHKDPYTKIRIILIVCLIAISRKLFTLGSTHVDPMHEFALAGLIIALGSAYFLVSKSQAITDSESDTTT